MNSSPPDVADLVRAYDKRWSSLDFVGLGDLWERDDPQPIYVGDEYAAPLIGSDELDRHWARVAGRLKSAAVSSTLAHPGEVWRAAIPISRPSNC